MPINVMHFRFLSKNVFIKAPSAIFYFLPAKNAYYFCFVKYRKSLTLPHKREGKHSRRLLVEYSHFKKVINFWLIITGTGIIHSAATKAIVEIERLKLEFQFLLSETCACLGANDTNHMLHFLLNPTTLTPSLTLTPTSTLNTRMD